MNLEPIPLREYKAILRLRAWRTVQLLELWRAAGHYEKIQLFNERISWCRGGTNAFLLAFRYALRGGSLRGGRVS